MMNIREFIGGQGVLFEGFKKEGEEKAGWDWMLNCGRWLLDAESWMLDYNADWKLDKRETRQDAAQEESSHTC